LPIFICSFNIVILFFSFRYAAPERKILREDVRADLRSLISTDKLRQVRASGRPVAGDDMVMASDLEVFALPHSHSQPSSLPPFESFTNGYSSSVSPRESPSRRSSTSSSVGRRLSAGSVGSAGYPMQEKTRAGVAVTPRGSYQLHQVSLPLGEVLFEKLNPSQNYFPFFSFILFVLSFSGEHVQLFHQDSQPDALLKLHSTFD